MPVEHFRQAIIVQYILVSGAIFVMADVERFGIALRLHASVPVLGPFAMRELCHKPPQGQKLPTGPDFKLVQCRRARRVLSFTIGAAIAGSDGETLTGQLGSPRPRSPFLRG